MIELRLSDAAKLDIRETRDWYEAKAAGLDCRFRDELERAFQQIREFPRSHPVVYRSVRRAVLRTFPYSIFYIERDEDWLVLGLVHHARHPRTWPRYRPS